MYKYHCTACNIISEIEKPEIKIDEDRVIYNDSWQKELDKEVTENNKKHWWNRESYYGFAKAFHFALPTNYTECPVCKTRKYF